MSSEVINFGGIEISDSEEIVKPATVRFPRLPPKVAWTKKWGFSKKKCLKTWFFINFFCTEVKLFPFNKNEMEDCIVVLFTAIVALASYNDVLFGGGTT